VLQSPYPAAQCIQRDSRVDVLTQLGLHPVLLKNGFSTVLGRIGVLATSSLLNSKLK
jgi:hypothetical protein